MISREAFEKCNPVPADAIWSERKQGYYWSNYPYVNHPFDNDWMIWQEACEWQASIFKSQASKPITTDDDVERVAKMSGWDNRRYMNPEDYKIWCERMREFVRLSSTPKPDERCSWWLDSDPMDGNDWISDCGASFIFIDDGPVINGFQYCPKYGRKLSQPEAGGSNSE